MLVEPLWVRRRRRRKEVGFSCRLKKRKQDVFADSRRVIRMRFLTFDPGDLLFKHTTSRQQPVDAPQEGDVRNVGEESNTA